ncbi:hypothetical protein GCM10025734_16100 [Kitasatospora paranensis]
MLISILAPAACLATGPKPVASWVDRCPSCAPDFVGTFRGCDAGLTEPGFVALTWSGQLPLSHLTLSRLANGHGPGPVAAVADHRTAARRRTPIPASMSPRRVAHPPCELPEPSLHG